MNYIAQINAFENWLEYNELSAGPQLLWYKLMHVANKSGWQSELSIANTRLQSLTKCSEKSLINNRNLLIQNGLLQYKKRGRTKAGIYILTDLTTGKTTVKELTTGNIPVDVTVKREVDMEVDSTVETEVNTSAYINKTKLNKTKLNKNDSGSFNQNSISTYTAVSYWLEQVNPAEAPTILESINFWVEDFKGSQDIVILAIDEMLKNGARSYKYLEKVLKNWESRKLDTVDKVHKFLNKDYQRVPENANKKTAKNSFPWWSDMTNDELLEYEKMTDEERKERGWFDE